MTKAGFKKIMEDKIIGVDQVSYKKDGTIVLMREFFYTHGQTSKKFSERILKQFDTIGIADQIDFIEHYTQMKVFKGGASTANSSHFGLIIKLKEDSK